MIIILNYAIINCLDKLRDISLTKQTVILLLEIASLLKELSGYINFWGVYNKDESQKYFDVYNFNNYHIRGISLF